ncbi:zinc finger protein ZAT1-like [Gastrolobium bilobum]|uniref:zinc finger protein ZAT1-like n=1 Tax=Gastrolobium bilobum TaxID=150636 RepID=UPI002AB08CE2|nr:zinc finger protein ZAT1-like [Gastrolobium bilobum]
MEKHKCKLCSRTFANGRALGGHMKAHLATLPLPPKPEPFTESLVSLSYFSSSPEEEEEEEKALIYGLRENPKKSFRLADPEFSFAPDTGSVVQDRESETESKNPTRQRSKRNRKSSFVVSHTQNLEPPKNPKMSFIVSLSTQPTEPEPMSSVSNTSPEEDVAMCLMMLSRDKWRKNNVVEHVQEQEEQGKISLNGCNKEIKFKRVRGKHMCDNCGKVFRSSRALGSHRSICRGEGNNDKIFECPFCHKVFGSGQALGGHKRSHLMPSSSSTANDCVRLKESFIDLNLPAPEEEDNLSVVSDA